MHRACSIAITLGALSAGSALGGGCDASKAQASSCEGQGAVATTVAYGGMKANKDIVTTAVEAGNFKTLAAALQAAGLVETLQGEGPFTVFAPTDAAFAKLPAGTVESLLRPENKGKLIEILTYHVVPGKVSAEQASGLKNASTVNGQRIDIKAANGKVMIDNATVTAADVWASNGVIHVIDTVIMPSTNDIVETAVAAGSFKTLAAALEAAGLVSTLQGDGPFTVFAPTDEAFAKLPAGTVESLLRPENVEKLRAVLTYHVVPGRVYADQVVTMNAAPTVQGSKVKISTKGGKVMIDGAEVVKTDIDATNGVIHVIDAVILPPAN